MRRSGGRSGIGRTRGARAALALLLAVTSAGSAFAAPDEGGDGSGISRRRAFFLSLLVPGLGQHASGHSGRAAFFFTAEAAIWSTSAAFKIVGKMRQDDVRQFAAIRAGADGSQDSEDYYQLLADYRSSDDYNVAVRQIARDYYENREDQLRFIAENSITDERDWRWPDAATQRSFQLLRHDALSANRTAVLATGWAVVNHLVSAIEAARSARPRDQAEAGEPAEPLDSRGSARTVSGEGAGALAAEPADGGREDLPSVALNLRWLPGARAPSPGLFWQRRF